MSRPTWHEYFMALCDVVSTRATCDRKHVGAVIVKNNRILSVGYNGALAGQAHCNERACYWCGYAVFDKIPRDKLLSNEDCPKCSKFGITGTIRGGHYIENNHCVRVLHSEQNAIAHAARAGVALEGAIIYCNTLPCWDCLKLIVGSGIVEAIYKDDYPSSGKGPMQDFLDQLSVDPNKFKLTPYSNLVERI